jgi:hypothetical protein
VVWWGLRIQQVDLLMTLWSRQACTKPDTFCCGNNGS